MSTDAPKLWRRSVFGCKVEATTGTAVSLAAADGVFNAYNALIDEQSPAEERPGQNAFSELQPIPGAQGGVCTLETDLYGSGTGGTVPAWVTSLLLSCGFQNSAGVVTPLTAQPQTLTMGVYRDGRLKQICGAQGSVTFDLQYGKTGKAMWKFEGKWVAPSDVSNIAPTFPVTPVPPKLVSASITVGGVSVRVSQMKIAIENGITLRPDINDASGYHAAYIVHRKILISMDPEAVALSTQNLYNLRDSGTSVAISATLGSTAGNQIVFAAPNAFILPPPKDKNRGDLYADEIVFKPARSAAAGDDEVSMTF